MRSVLIVEDDVINTELLKEMLRRHHCKVQTAPNGKVGVEMALNESYDLIFMDLHMPEMDGFQASRAIRNAGKPVPIIALTANIMEGVKHECQMAGMSDYLSKPIELEDIGKILYKHLS